MNKFSSYFIYVLFAFTLMNCSTPKEAENSHDLVISGGRVMDPESGLDAIRNIGINNGQIAEISENDLSGDQVIEAEGLVVTPGFIDLHEHGQTEEAYKLMVQDGVTSAFELEVGTGNVSAWYDERQGGQIVNYGVSIGHIPVRMEVMNDPGEFLPSGPGNTAPASEEQIEEIKRMVEEGLTQGAVAVGFGLAYTTGATVEEYESVLQIAADHGASAHIHVRGGPGGINEAINGAINTGASLHVVHANSSGGAETAEFLNEIQKARDAGHDITTEAYPYEAGMTMIESALFDDWESWDDERIQTHQWAETGERLTRESFGTYREQGGGVIIHSRSEDMTLTAITSPLTMIASDGFILDGKGHPRTSGSYAKVLGKYVRELGVLDLMNALRKMSIDPARRLESYVAAMKNKGRLQKGTDADITIFDPNTIIDKATYLDPTIPSEGIQYVLVNGEVVVKNGVLVPNVKPGKAVRKE